MGINMLIIVSTLAVSLCLLASCPEVHRHVLSRLTRGV